MRIIIQFYYDFLRKKTAAIDIEDEEADCSILLKAISVKVDRPLHEILATVKKDSIPVRIVQGWPISFYEIRDMTQVNVEFKDQDNDDNKKKQSAMNNRYLMKLGINKNIQDKRLSVIRDFEEEDNEDDNDGEAASPGATDPRRRKSSAKSLKKNSQHSGSSSSDDENTSSKTYDLKRMLENYLEQLIRETKNNKLEEIQKIFADVPEKLPTEKKEELQFKKLNLINQLGKDGSTPLHHAVQLMYSPIVKEFVDKGANVNIPNQQGWTSVQTSIHKNDLKTLKILLESATLDLNYVSSVGTALTVACQFSRTQALAILLEKNPEINLTDSSGKTCLDYCQKDEIKSLIKAHSAKLKEEAEEEQKQSGDKQLNLQPTTISIPASPVDLLPPKPPIVRGILYKIGSMIFSKRERYFVINPDEGTLIRYKHVTHYPLRPLEVIPLKDISHIQMITKSWFMSSDYTYFEINYPNRQVLACKFEQAAKKWVEYLFQASVYSYYMESKNSFNVSMLQDNVTVDLIDNANHKLNQGAIGGSIREAVHRFEASKMSMKASPSDQQRNGNNQQQSQSSQKQGAPSTQKTLPPKTVSVATTNLSAEEKKGNKSAESKGDVRNARDHQSNEQSSLKQASTKGSNDRSPSPQSQKDNNKASSPNNQSPKNKGQDEEPPEEGNVDLGVLKDEKVTFESFQILKVLGAGSFGKVFLAKKKDTGLIYAIKALKKRPLIVKRQLRYAVTEANVLKMCNHPFIIGLHFAFQTPNYLYLVLDYCNGGDVSRRLAYKRRFTEEEAVFYIAELILAVNHIHEKDVVYRDLKPENILIDSEGHIKLADFGLSKDNVSDSAKTKSFCGTPAYLSPEMLNNKGASKASDIYGIGAVLYEMLTGDPPYYNDDIPTMYKKIKEGNLTFPNYVSLKAKNLINGLLDRNPKTRLGANDREQLKRDPFFESIDWDRLYNREYQAPITEFDNSDIEDDFEDISDKKIFTDLDYEANNATTNRVKQFSFVRK